jgi:hypothetical protein
MKKIFTFLFSLLIGVQMWAWQDGSATITLTDDGTIIISGTVMANYEATGEGRPGWIKEGHALEIKKVVAQSSVERIGSNAFRDCANIASVELDNKDLTIGASAFYGCKSLTSITLPENTTKINSGVFCKAGLTSITIPASVTAIGGYAFYNCPLTFIRCKAEVPPTIEDDVTTFQLVSRDIPVYVPYGSVDDYKAADVWKEFTNILPDPEQCPTYGNCGLQGDNLTWSLDCEGTLIISGTGAMTNYEKGKAPWSAHVKKIKTILMSEGITSIGNYAFTDCQNAALTSIVIPNGVLTIGIGAFYNCRNITNVNIASSVQVIGEEAFKSCVALKTLTLPSSLTKIESAAFLYCPLTSILCAALVPPTCIIKGGADPFYGVSRDIDVFVPASEVDDYKAADVWKEFTKIQATGLKRISWLDEDGKPIQEVYVEDGQTPVFSGENPVKAEDENYTYEFIGWLPKTKPVDADYHYVAHFNRTSKKDAFNATIKGENCKLEIINQVPAGTVLTVKAVPDECLQFTKWSDDETANPRTITVTEDTELTAELNKVTYTITDESQNGHLNIAPKQ